MAAQLKATGIEAVTSVNVVGESGKDAALITHLI
jgi:hypothetical protein